MAELRWSIRGWHMVSHFIRAIVMALVFSSLWIRLFLMGHNSILQIFLGSVFIVGMILYATSPILFASINERKRFNVMLLSWLTGACIGIAWLIRFVIGSLEPRGGDYQTIHSVLSDGDYWWIFAPRDPDFNVVSATGMVHVVLAAIVLLITIDKLATEWKKLAKVGGRGQGRSDVT
jgi:hypothetical protein